jgi:hypothetical protein
MVQGGRPIDLTVFLVLAILCLAAGFSLLASSIRNWLDPRTRAQVASISLARGATILVLAAASGVLFGQYAVRSQKQGQDARLEVYEQFSKLPRIERMASAGLKQSIHNDDEISADGATWLTVALSPTSAFFEQFHAWKQKDGLWLKMRVTAPGFDVFPLLDETQQVPGDALTFAWILRAQKSGDQVVNVRGVAFRENSSGVIYDRATVVNAMRSIRVKHPFSIDAWMPIVTALIGLLGTGALPLFFQAIKRKSPQQPSTSA